MNASNQFIDKMNEAFAVQEGIIEELAMEIVDFVESQLRLLTAWQRQRLYQNTAFSFFDTHLDHRSRRLDTFFRDPHVHVDEKVHEQAKRYHAFLRGDYPLMAVDATVKRAITSLLRAEVSNEFMRRGTRLRVNVYA